MARRTPILFLLIFLLGFPGSEAVAFATVPVLISQVHITGGAGRADADFVELFNHSDKPFNLRGLRLVKRSRSATTDVTVQSWGASDLVPPMSFYLWANKSLADLPLPPDTVTAVSLGDDSGVALRQGDENNGLLVDSVSWGKARNGYTNVSAPNPGPDQSLLRQDLSGGQPGFVVAVSRPRNSSISEQIVLPGSGQEAPGIPPQAATTPEQRAGSTLSVGQNNALIDFQGQILGTQSAQTQSQGLEQERVGGGIPPAGDRAANQSSATPQTVRVLRYIVLPLAVLVFIASLLWVIRTRRKVSQTP